MEETKRCPYCGEEVKAAAKKCRHCGEWLDGMPSGEKTVNPERESPPMTNPDKMDGKLLVWSCIACWAAIVLEIVSSVQSWQEISGVKSGGRGLSGLIGWIFNPIANTLPEWLVTLALGGLWVVLLLGLRSFCRMKDITGIPFIALVCTCIGGFFFNLILCFVEDEDIGVVLVCLALPIIIAYSVLSFIAGIKLCNSKISQTLGILFMVYAVIPIVAMIVDIGLFGEYAGHIFTFVDLLVSIYLLKELKNLLESVSEDEVEA